ncbi:MAG: Methyltransferase, FkbM family [Belnapia sp.]|nr:Methyltransferase, FkbM family [Belnapia sp.]
MDEIGFHRCLHRPGTLLDIGAHDGGFTLPLAALPASRVLAFEPLPASFARLRAAVGEAANVTLRQEALGDATGTVVLSVPVVDGLANEQWASIAKTYAGHGPRVAEQRFAVPLRRLDEFALTDLTGVKLDAEGAEYEVLRGGRETLLRCRPVLSIEIEERHRPGATWAVPAWLDALGYDGFFEHWGEWRPMAGFDRSTMQVASPDPTDFRASDPYIFVFYFLPREHAAAMLASLRTAATTTRR